jgi:hypothetical protein
VYEGQEMAGAPVEAGGEPSEVFEFVEAALNAVAMLVGLAVVRDGDFARAG